MNSKTTKTWEQYRAGLEYKRRIGLFERVRKNERYLRGDQWQGSDGVELPKPVFNVIRRIIDFIVGSIMSKKASIVYTDASIPFCLEDEKKSVIRKGIKLLSQHAEYRWEHSKMNKVMQNALYDAALSGDGVLYSYFDPDKSGVGELTGDIVTENVDSVNLFVSDVNCADIQSQDYVILSGRQSVLSLRREAEQNGLSYDEAKGLITPDSDSDVEAGDCSDIELSGEDEEKATYLIKFWREQGTVCFDKSTQRCVIRRGNTGCKLYPVAYFNWYSTKNCFHGTSPITALIPNQNFINRGFAMAMKHMTDTAFSKVIYDKTKIPEWTNRVGEAIAAVGGGNVSDAVSVVGVGEMQSDYLTLLDNTLNYTKELCGATETALGNAPPTNTSAILAMQEAAKVPLHLIRDNYRQCIEDVANIWADMICAYFPPERLIPYLDGGEAVSGRADTELLMNAVLEAHVEVTDSAGVSVAANQAVLDKLLDGGFITVSEYLERLPDGVLPMRDALVEKYQEVTTYEAEIPVSKEG